MANIRAAWTTKTKDLPGFIEGVLQNHPVRDKHWEKWRKILFYFYGEDTDFISYVEREPYYESSEHKDIEIKINRLLSIIRTYIAKLTRDNPIIEIIPTKHTEEDLRKAETANMVLDYVWNRNNLNEKILPLWLLNTFTMSAGIVKLWFNSLKKAEVVKGEEISFEQIGDIEVGVVKNYNFFPDPDATDIEDCRYIIHAYPIAVEEAEAYFGGEFKADVDITDFDQSTSLSNMVMVKEYYEKPNPKNPDGRFVVVINDKIVFKSKYQFIDPKSGEAFYPFVKVIAQPTHDQDFWGYPIIKDLIPVQKYYNAINSKILKNISLMADIQWAVPEGNIAARYIENIPGQVIVYSAQEGQVYQIAPKPLPHHVLAMRQFLAVEFEEISGQHEVSQGKAPYANMPTSALQLLLEQDETRMAVTLKQFFAGLRELAIKILKMAKIFYDEKRLIRIVGEDNITKVEEIQNTDFDFADVKTILSQAMPVTKQGKTNFSIMLWNAGIVRDPRKILKLLQLDTLDVFYKRETMDIERARRENEMIRKLADSMEYDDRLQQAAEQFMTGNAEGLFEISPIKVMKIDDHFVHIEEHGKFAKSLQFEKLHPFIQELLLRHIDEHYAFIEQQAQKAQQAKGQQQQNINIEDQLQEAMLTLPTGGGNIPLGGSNE